MFDNHIHSRFSADSKLLPEDIIKKAIEEKLIGIAFTEHIDYEMPGYEDFFVLDFEKYFEEITHLKNKFLDKLKISIGIEVGQTPKTFKSNLEVIKKYDFDYVLSSVHVVNGEDVYQKSYFEEKTQKKAYALYLETIFNTINNFKNFDMMAHFDYLTREAPYKNRLLKYKDFPDYFDEIFKSLISLGKGFELNTSIGKFVPKEDIFDIDILKRYKELGGEKICLGSDSHDTNRIASNFDYCQYLLKKVGFNYLIYFENRMPYYVTI